MDLTSLDQETLTEGLTDAGRQTPRGGLGTSGHKVGGWGETGCCFILRIGKHGWTHKIIQLRT